MKSIIYLLLTAALSFSSGELHRGAAAYKQFRFGRRTSRGT